MAERLLKVKGTQLYYQDYSEVAHLLTGTVVAGSFSGNLKVKGTYLHYMDDDGVQRRLLGTLTGQTLAAGRIKNKGDYLYYGDYNNDERYIVLGGISDNIDVINYTTWDVYHQTVKVYDNLCVVIWEGSSLPVKMGSYYVDSAGNMSDTFLDTHDIYIGEDYAFPTGSILVGNGIVATLFSQWAPYLMVLKTHKVETDGSISHIDTWIVTDWPTDEEYNGGSHCDIIHVADTTYAILLRGGENSDYLILRTVQINADGTFPETINDEVVKYGKSPTKTEIISMGSSIFVVARETRVGENLYGVELNSYTISDAGGITTGDTKTIYAAMERNTHSLSTCRVNSGVIAIIIYRNIWETSTPSFVIKTIAMTGANFGALLDTEDLTPIGTEPHIIPVSGDIFLYAYRPAQSTMRTVTISATGVIGDTVSERAPMGGYDSYLMHVLGGIYTINYASTVSGNGIIVSFMVG